MVAENLLGVATAVDIQKKEGVVSLVRGAHKSELRIIDRRVENFSGNLISNYVDFLKASIEWALMQQPNGYKMPVVHGISDDLPASLLMQANFFSWQIGQKIASSISDNHRIEIHKWGFTPSTSQSLNSTHDTIVPQLTPEERGEFFNQLVGSSLIKKYKGALRHFIDSGGKDERVFESVEKIAKIAALAYQQQREHMIKTQGSISFARFSSVAGKCDIRNSFLDFDILKQIYGKVIMREMESVGNVCIKSANAPSSPPFADVVATMIADQIDQRNGTSACVVGVNHDPIICL